MPADLPDQTLLTAHDILTIFRVTLPTLRIWRRNGVLPEPLRFGRSLRWRRQDIEAVLCGKGVRA